MKKRNVLFISIAIIILAASAGGAYYLYEDLVNIDTIYDGIYIGEYNVGGMTEQEAVKYIKTEKMAELSEKSMTLNYGDKDYKLSLEDLGFSYDYDGAAKLAFAKGRKDQGPISRYREIKNLSKENWQVNLESSYSESKIKDQVENIAEEMDQDPIDATFSFDNGNFSVTEDQPGLKVIKEELVKTIEGNMEELKDIDIPLEELNPKFTREYYGKINGVLGEYSTSFKGSSAGRVENIRLSARSFNNLVVHPGEEISYNEITGPKNSSNGYREAPVIFDGELVPGLGGGVCQTSTTLYNTLLLADLTITERSPHSLPPTYVSLGRDAAVASGYLDLKFKNTFDYPIYMTSKLVGNRVYFYVYGDASSRDYTVRISEEITEFKPFTTKEILDETMEAGTEKIEQQGRNGYKSKTYKSIIKDGKVISSKQINSDYYRERQHIVKHGIKIPEKLDPENKDENPDSLENPKEAGDEKPVEGGESSIESPEEIVDENISLDPIEEKPEP